MNINSLHHYLTQLSDSEKRYQSGHCFSGWDTLPKVTIHGRKVYRMFPDKLLLGSMHGENPVSPDIFDIPVGFQDISIKRNSRFNPVPEHVHSHIEINYVYSGKCPQHIDGKPVILKKDQVLLIDTDCPHSIESLDKNDIMISILIHKSFLRDHMFSQLSKDSILSRFFINAINEQTSHDHYLLFHSENDRRIPLFFSELFCEFLDPSVNTNDIIFHLFYLIIAELINIYENDLTKDSDSTGLMPVVSMIRYIQNNFRTCTQENVAEFFHISPNYVSILLKKYTGYTYIQLIQEQKLQFAATMLRTTTLSVTAIANESGYENISFFYKKFQEKYHCSPNDYRTRR
ncbi:AraC family transcriptional regulator [Blautia sp. MSJ-19]|uniref:AraC family transcriptional regulator n=1 Tax=Blautia sp. MSJ-19 TaxID=2841517 RepID=UPI001C0ED20A|nr:AraC family transcriptional regulator [Blautia sp. MSJ-19]MBU5480619.1 AraC family transcriptional regulator [Blautia sp. MSJ-19]